jgi:hypothetical protein
MKKLVIFLLLFAAFNANAQESFFRGNNNYVAPLIVLPTISTSSITSIYRYGANSGGTLIDNGGAPILSSGICWSATSNLPTITDSKTTDGLLSLGTFVSSLTGLTAGVIYNVRAYATNSAGTAYGVTQTFTTTSTTTTIPILTTSVVSAISSTTAITGGTITDQGSTLVSSRGLVYGTSAGSSTYSVTSGSGAGTFTTTLTGLTQGTRYYVRSFATNVQGTGYGAEISFTTQTTATVSATVSVTSITGTTATGGGTITTDGGSSVTSRGLVWGTTSGSSTYSVTTGTGTGTYTSSITGLNNGTTYFVRAFAVNSVGTTYGPEVQFATPSTATVASTITSTITSSTAILGGVLSSNGGATTSIGVMYSTASNFGTFSTTTINANAVAGSYTTTISGLSELTTYYGKAFATNAAGTVYGPAISFTTTSTPIIAGSQYQGGVIAYVLQSGDPGYDPSTPHGLIAAISDQSTGIRWGNGTLSITNANGTAIGTGLANTNRIITSQGAVSTSYAAGLARAYNGGGYNDWYLPSKNELNKLYLNKTAIGGFSSGEYSSSSEETNAYPDYDVWRQRFSDGYQLSGDYGKQKLLYVRAIRSF